MTRKFLWAVLVLLMCGFSIPSYAGWDDDDWDDDDWETELDKAGFEGEFEACVEWEDLLDDDKQCICIRRVIKNTLSPEDYKKARALSDEGRNGSAGKIYKKALSAAYDACF